MNVPVRIRYRPYGIGLLSLWIGFSITSVFAVAAAPAGLGIARANACLGCHATDRKLVGPSFQHIANRYRSDPQAPAKLEQKVKNGGAGVWGVIPMPAHPRMTDADIHTVVGWILAGAPSSSP